MEDTNIEQKMCAAKMGTLRSMNGVIRKDRIRNECVRISFGEVSMKSEAIENKKWFVHDVLRRDESVTVELTMQMGIEVEEEDQK